MITAVVTGVVALVVAFCVVMLRKGGKDAARADAAEETINDIQNANRPLSDPELQRVRERWRRD